MNRTLRRRLDRVAQRLGPRGMLSKAEAQELAALTAECGSLPPIEQMNQAELDAWLREWACGPKGSRMGELRERARTPDERRADEENAAMFAQMSLAELDRWLLAQTREDLADPEGEPLAEQG